MVITSENIHIVLLTIILTGNILLFLAIRKMNHEEKLGFMIGVVKNICIIAVTVAVVLRIMAWIKHPNIYDIGATLIAAVIACFAASRINKYKRLIESQDNEHQST